MLGFGVGLVQRPQVPPPLLDANLTGAPSLPAGLTHIRGSPAWDYDFASYATDVPRLTASGLLYEEARTNTFSYSRLNDAAIQSTSQTLGTSVLIDGSGGGLTVEVLAVGTESGVPYLDYRVSGSRTGTGTQFYDVVDEAETIGASANDPDTVSAWIKLVSGSIPPEINLTLFRHYRDAANALISSGQVLVSPDGSLRRYSNQSLAPATTTRIGNRGFYVRATETAANLDFTVRVGAIQHEQNTMVGSSPIVTTGSQAARAADRLNVGLANGSYDVLVERAGLDGVVAKAFVDAIASAGAGWDVPIDMAAPYLQRLRAWPVGALSAARKAALTA